MISKSQCPVRINQMAVGHAQWRLIQHNNGTPDIRKRATKWLLLNPFPPLELSLLATTRSKKMNNYYLFKTANYKKKKNISWWLLISRLKISVIFKFFFPGLLQKNTGIILLAQWGLYNWRSHRTKSATLQSKCRSGASKTKTPNLNLNVLVLHLLSSMAFFVPCDR